MVLFPSLFDGLSRTALIKKGRNSQKDAGKEAVEAMAKDAKKNDLMLSSSGFVRRNRSNNFASICSKRGQKGINQDCLIVWEEFGCQKDMIFCGIFDGHGPWGHVVAKRVRESLPSSLLCKWQETLALTLLGMEFEEKLDRNLHQFDIWKQSYLKTYAAIDLELKQHPAIDSFCSGTTALTIVKQGERLVIANVGDSRAVLATTSDDGSLVPLQLTVDFKPNLPQEAERITQSNGRVFYLHDEPGVYRVWMPNGKTPGLALSRAIGDHCVKEFGLISEPDVTQRNITSRDQFVILATDGVWDVISNQEAVQIVSSTPDREKSAKRLVECAVCAWKYKKRGIAIDDISAICLFFHSSSSQQTNTMIYQDVFSCVPNDLIHSRAALRQSVAFWKDRLGHTTIDLGIAPEKLESYQNGDVKNSEPTERLQSLQGHLVSFPLDFMCKEDLRPVFNESEYYASQVFY